MANILFYVPFNQRSRDTESVMLAFRKQGHTVICLSQLEGYLINDFLNAHGITAVSHVIKGPRTGWWYYCRHLFFFVKFCWKHDIHVVYSHLEPANFVAAVGQYLIRAKTYLCRHHVDEGRLYNFDKSFSYNLTYSLARRIIVVSRRAKEYMITQERVPERKILHINLAYDFDLYDEVNLENAKLIKGEYASEVLLVTACRLTKFKRPQLAIQLVKNLVDHGCDAKLIILGRGEMVDELQQLIGKLSLNDRVFMKGFVNNVLEFMKAADYFVHPSILDSSCIAVKEAGLVKLPPILCRGIGDFEDYIVNGENGFLVNADDFVVESTDVILKSFCDKGRLEGIGRNLEKTVLDRFNINNVVACYSSLNQIS